MLRNVFLKTLYDMRGSIIAWALGLAFLAVLVVGLFHSVRRDKSLENLDAIVQHMAPGTRAIVAGENLPSVTSFEGFSRMEFLSYLPLLLAIFTIVEGSGTIGLEEERRTIDLLMAQPIRRWRVVVEKSAALVVATYAIAASAGFGLVATTRLVSVETPWYRMMLATANAVPPALVVGALSMLGSCALRRRRNAIIAGSTFLVASYFLNVLGQIAEPIKPWRKLSIFCTYCASLPLTGEMITKNTVWLLAATIILFAIAMFAFERKELAA
ncbi:MAG: ABC transporter permease subunit [Thermoguttaceae bacterium]|jgi:ABC-2 type transport system permease protein